MLIFLFLQTFSKPKFYVNSSHHPAELFSASFSFYLLVLQDCVADHLGRPGGGAPLSQPDGVLCTRLRSKAGAGGEKTATQQNLEVFQSEAF